MTHSFKESLAFSTDHETAPFWEEAYRYFFPGHAAIIRHTQDGDHQRLGIDTTVVMENSKVYTVDEKHRRGSWTDILLEEWSDQARRVPGWVCKPLLCDYILYAVPDIGRAYLLPCAALQAAWSTNADQWRRTCKRVEARNRNPATGRQWTSLNWAIPERVLFPALGQQFRAKFEPSANGLDGMEVHS